MLGLRRYKMAEEGFFVEGKLEMKEGEEVIAAPWAEIAYQEYLTYLKEEKQYNAGENELVTNILRSAFAAGWYSANEAKKFHGRG